MAEIAVDFVVEKIGDTLLRKAIFLKGVHEQVVRLRSELNWMKCFLKDADERQQDDERVRNWVSEIRDLAYDAEDAIDVFIFNVESGRTKFFPWRMFKKLVSSYKVGKEIEAIQTKIQDISRSRETYGINSVGEATSRASQRLQKLRQTSSRVEEEVIVGLKEETDKLVKQLVEGDERRRVVSITGMGGIGKTTLAKKVYNHSRVVCHFQDYRAWVYVSQDCRPREIFQQILNQIPCTPTEEEAKKIEKLQEKEFGNFLHDCLKEKRYLVVLDDIWNSEDWKYLANVFPKESKGSRLILTTRNRDVAWQADAQSVPHEMQLLSEEECWKLFCRTAIPDNVIESCPPELKEFGEKMVKKCAGLPLAIVVLGGLLSSKKQLRTEWEKVLNNLVAHFSRGQGVDTVLNLSYIDLPYNLRSCFLYLGLFPEDQVIPTRKLLLLWIAEGFIPQQDEQRMEDTAEDYLNELINRNLVQVAAMSLNEKVTKCRMHDLIRELSIKRAKEENFFEVQNSIISLPSTSSSLLPTKSRRQGIYFDLERYASLPHSSTPYLRTLLFFELKDKFSRISQLDFLCKYFKLLRVLDLEGVVIINPPSSLGKLIHLRYLRLRKSQMWCFFKLPTSLGNLRSLQTLDINFIRVPTMIQKMENLRHLFISYDGSNNKPLRIDTLRNLQTLSSIRFRDWQKNDTSKLTSLRKLKIQGEFDFEVAQFSNSISNLKNLRSLYLETLDPSGIPSFVMNSWLHLSKLHMKGYIQQLPNAQEFPPNLTQLTLEGTRLDYDPMAILEKLQKLLTLKLRKDSYLGAKMQVSANGFPQLKILQLSGLHRKKRLNMEKDGMSKLTQLQIFKSALEIDGLSELLHLRKVDIIDTSLHRRQWISSLPCSSEWHNIRRKTEDGSDIWHYYR